MTYTGNISTHYRYAKNVSYKQITWGKKLLPDDAGQQSNALTHDIKTIPSGTFYSGLEQEETFGEAAKR